MLRLTSDHSALNSATDGLKYAEDVVAQLRISDEPIHVSFADIDRVTPSFANAFVMTLMEQLGLDRMKTHVRVVDAAPHIVATLAKSVQRYQSGIRLSTQRLPAAS